MHKNTILVKSLKAAPVVVEYSFVGHLLLHSITISILNYNCSDKSTFNLVQSLIFKSSVLCNLQFNLRTEDSDLCHQWLALLIILFYLEQVRVHPDTVESSYTMVRVRILYYGLSRAIQHFVRWSLSADQTQAFNYIIRRKSKLHLYKYTAHAVENPTRQSKQYNVFFKHCGLDSLSIKGWNILDSRYHLTVRTMYKQYTVKRHTVKAENQSFFFKSCP